MHAQTMFDPSLPLATSTVQDIHLELIILAVDEAAAHRLAALAESWGGQAPHL